MRSLPFCKFHGFGNDYIVIERANVPDNIELPELARQICCRHTGAGADGIAVIKKSEDGDCDLECEIINPDGSAAGFSGNGTRCAAAYSYYKELWSDGDLRLKTPSGIKRFHLLGTEPGTYTFEAEIGRPLFLPAEVPVRASGRGDAVVDEPINIDGGEYAFSAVNVGNPVACVFVDDFQLDWRSIGKSMESHGVFPQRCNIVFVRPVDAENIEIRIWERGAGETAASGTCASGAAVVCASAGKTGRRVAVHSPGGISRVFWREDDEIVLTGTAELVYEAQWPLRT